MDVKPMIIQPMRVKIQGNRVYLNFLLPVLSQGVYNLKIYGNVGRIFNMPWIPDAFICSRTGTYYYDGIRRITPFSEDIFFRI